MCWTLKQLLGKSCQKRDLTNTLNVYICLCLSGCILLCVFTLVCQEEVQVKIRSQGSVCWIMWQVYIFVCVCVCLWLPVTHTVGSPAQELLCFSYQTNVSGKNIHNMLSRDDNQTLSGATGLLDNSLLYDRLLLSVWICVCNYLCNCITNMWSYEVIKKVGTCSGLLISHVIMFIYVI